ncbi:MAG: peptidoglycan-binding protein [Oscillospiraceae bacterium]|jgi:hypothetical protein|nr:peptidoglycan-binding protein [Oscillospiraceae bacterium]
MATILVYNNQTDRMERFERAFTEPMPYANQTLLVGEFRGTSQSFLLWTQRAAMQSWVQFRALWNRPIYLPYCFRRIGEGGHASQSQHYAGVSFDCAQNLTNAERTKMRQLASSSGLWTYVEPASLTPTWVHMDRRSLPAACSAGYPLTREGMRGVYVCILQDALNLLQNANLTIDGNFGPATRAAVVQFQSRRSLTPDGIVGCATWQRLTALAVGSGLPLDMQY